jgi:hypothetical protein
MNGLLDMAAPPRTSGEWMSRHAWQASAQGKWRHETPIPIKGEKKARPLLVARHDSSQWEAWHLVRGAIVPPTKAIAPGEGVLIANAALAGTGKYVGQDSHPVEGETGLESFPTTCRFDLPRELLGHQGEGDLADMQHPVEAWVQDVTALATGASSPSRSPAASLNLVHTLVDKAGWPTTAADGVLRISMPLPGLYRQILIDLAYVDGPRVWCELADFADWTSECRTAAVHLALAANERLRLVRFALVGEQDVGCDRRSALAPSLAGPGATALRLSHPARLVAEVVLGSARVPGAWLDVALECVHAAIVLTARELSALRDPELAKWYLSAHGLETA